MSDIEQPEVEPEPKPKRKRSRRSRIRHAATITVAAIAVGGGGAWAVGEACGCSLPIINTPPPPPSGVANMFVEVGAGACTRSATLIDYAASASPDRRCGTWDAAHDLCQNNDTVIVRGGSYGSVSISQAGAPARSAPCTFNVAAGENVTMTTWDNGVINGGDTGADWLTVNGNIPCRAETATCSISVDEFDNDQVANTRYDGWDINSHDTGLQPFHVESNGTFTWRNSRVHNATDTNGMSLLTGNGPWLFEDSDFYDVRDTTNGANHTECAWTGMNNVTIRRTRWYTCAVQGIFLTSNELATNWLVENNFFGNTVDSPNSTVFAFRTGTPPSPSPDGFIFRYNTLDGGMQFDDANNTPTSNGFQVYGNYMRSGPPCGLPNTTYGYNAAPGGVSCGTNNVNATLAAFNAGFIAADFSGLTGGNYNLTSSSPLRNTGNPANFPPLDAANRNRFFGSAPDIGAYEFPE